MAQGFGVGIVLLGVRASGFASGSCRKRPEAHWMAALSHCGMGGSSFHKQMLRQPNHCLIGASTCTLVRDLTGTD